MTQDPSRAGSLDGLRVMVIDDSIVRSGLRVARTLGLGGLAPASGASGPVAEINPDAVADDSWGELQGDGTIRKLVLSAADINTAFAGNADPRAADRPLKEDEDKPYVDMELALVSVPAIGKAMLYEGE